jgi:hypothetical protein
MKYRHLHTAVATAALARQTGIGFADASAIQPRTMR